MKYTKNITKLPNSEVEIVSELSADDFSFLWPEAVAEIGKQVTVAGFRTGHAPEKRVVDQVGEEKILWEMAEKAISKIYPEIITSEKIDVIGQPEVSITKIAKGNPLGFKIKVAVLPEIKLPDYQKIAKEKQIELGEPELNVTEPEIDEFITNLQKMHQPKTDTEKTKEAPLPPIDDNFVKQFGDFKTVAEFKDKITDQLKNDKINKTREKNRVAILEAIAKATELELPPILIDKELHKMLHELEGQISQMGIKFDDYLKHLKKTQEELMVAWKPDAEKRVSIGLIMNKIAEVEKLTIPENELTEYTNMLIERLGKNQDLDHARVREYAENLLLNEKVIQLLEKSN